MVGIRKGPPLPQWQDGDQQHYWRWTFATSTGQVCQLNRRHFEFRSNTRLDVMEWLHDTTVSGELREYQGFRAEVIFDDDQGAALFKLTWC